MAEAKKKEAAVAPVVAADEGLTKKVKIKLPRLRDDAEDKVVWVNERRFLIKRGVEVEVPVAVADIIEHEEQMLDYIYDYESKMSQG